MHRKIIKGTGKSIVHATYDDGSKQVLTFYGPLDVEKIDEKLMKINKSRGAKSDAPPQDSEIVKLQSKNAKLLEDLKKLQDENQQLKSDLDELKKTSAAPEPEKSEKSKTKKYPDTPAGETSK